MASVVEWIPRPKITMSGQPNQTSQVHHFLAVLDSSDADPYQHILSYPDCPAYFTYLPGNNNLFVVDINIVQSEEAEQAFDVQVTYSNRWEQNGTTSQQGGQFTFIENPLQRPALISWDTYTTKEIVEYGYGEQDGPNATPDVPIITGAGEPILCEDEVDRRVINVVKNVSSVNPIFATRSNFVNKDNVRIGGFVFKPETLWLKNVRISPIQIENRIPFYSLSFSMFHREETWKRVLRNAGFYYRRPTRNGVPGIVEAITVNGSFPPNPVPLTADGGLTLKMAQYIGVIPTTDAQRAAIFTPQELKDVWNASKLTFRVKKRINFTGTVPLR